MTETDTESPQRPVSRRALAAGVAWSAPAVWLTAAAPAMAASPGLEIAFTQAMWSGNKDAWVLYFSIKNMTGSKVTVTGITVKALGSPLGTYTVYSSIGGKDIKAGNTTSFDNGQQYWTSFPDQSTSAGRFGAGPCGGTGSGNAGSYYTNYYRTATCSAATDTCTCTGSGSVCIGVCALLAMAGPFQVTVTASTGTKVVLFTAPASCGWKADCQGLSANYS